VGTIKVRQLIERFLTDPTVSRLRWQPQLSAMLAVWADEFGGARVRSFGRLQVEAMRDKILARRVGKADNAHPISAARVNRYMAAMRRAWRWGAVKGYVLPSAPWPAEIMLTEAPAKEVLATESEVALMFAACDQESKPLGALVRFLVGTGARLSDALAVRWRDVNEQYGDVAIRGQKTNRPLRVAMLAPAREALKTAAQVKHVSGRVFWQYEYRMAPRHEWLRARQNFPEHMRQMRMHDCRHLCASLLAANGATDIELAAQLGHSTLQMVKRYSHLRGGHRGAAHEKLDRALGGSVLATSKP
jgi:integrase